MKKIWTVLCLFAVIMQADEKVMQSIVTDVLQKNTQTAMDDAMKLYEDLNKKSSSKVIHGDFKNLVVSWKKVETFYLAAGMNEDSVDLPRYMDVFHNLKENLSEQMQRVIDSKESLDVEMYKNSFKTINALQYVLYSDSLNPRRIEIAKIIVNNILNRLDEINEVYLNDTQKFITNYKWGNEEIINMLIDSSFKLRDWRVGDMAGLSRKYKNKPDNTRAEYYLSENSKVAIESILQLHETLMGSVSTPFSQMLIKNGVENEVKMIASKIKEAQMNLVHLKGENFEDKKVKILYESLDTLHKTYYISLVNAVGISAKILDADGD